MREKCSFGIKKEQILKLENLFLDFIMILFIPTVATTVMILSKKT